MIFLLKQYILIVSIKFPFVKRDEPVFLPDYVKNILDTLARGGFDAYAVGGCVRDALLGKTPDDYDVATGGLPEETKKCFENFRVIETGIKHGTVTVLSEGHPVEVTTFRCDGEYKDNRHPESVTFTRTLNDDLSRRDFTVNAMAYSPAEGLVDLFGGKEDLAAGVIRCVGEPEQRFREDALRIMRCIRFASVLGFTVEKATAEAASALAPLLRNISAERIFTELKKLLRGQSAAETLLACRGILTEVFPGLRGVSNEAYAFAAERLSLLEETELKVTLFLSPLGSDGAKEALACLKCDNKQRKTTEFILNNLTKEFSAPGEVKRFAGEHGIERVKQLAQFRRATGKTDDTVLLSGIKSAEAPDACLKITDLSVNGADLAKLGKKGREIGDALQALLEAVTDGKVMNDKSCLMSYISG